MTGQEEGRMEDSLTCRTGQAVSREDQLISSSLVTYYTVGYQSLYVL